MGRFYLFGAAVEAGYVGLVLIGALSSLLSVYVYSRVVVSMYMRQEGPEPPGISIAPEALAVVLLTALATLGLGVAPSGLMEIVRTTVIALM